MSTLNRVYRRNVDATLIQSTECQHNFELIDTTSKRIQSRRGNVDANQNLTIECRREFESIGGMLTQLDQVNGMST
ncbi:unnamed protein product [Protopolystoma xenopodis]|uniref:Uncharacterized protein n=1 Tax=Protopolystoma xenopodis TaxID=117903 RepID=A0A448X6W3_9PLAT|nr:unnamed protein product [Protopolystoma xenopodis]